MIRVFEAFSGIGTQRMALRNLGINHEVVAIAEIDKYALKSYEAIHGDCPNLGDISKIETTDIPDHDLFTYSFPCQDISVAGKQAGLDMNGGTRSGLLWECQKVIAAKKPKYLLMENVKNLVGKKHKPNFDKWLDWLEEQGYTNYWQVLNAKDYGIPQNRERVFCVSILGEHEPYVFPEKQELTIRLKDVLEDEVDERFYLDDKKIEQLVSRFDLKDESFLLGGEQKNQSIKKDGISTTLTSSMGTGGGHIPMVNRIGGIFDKDGKTHQAGAIWDKDGLAPTLDTMQGGWRQPSVVIDNIEGIPIKNATKKGYLMAEEGDGIDTAYPESKTRRGRVQKDTAHTLTTDDSKGVVIAASRGRNPQNPSDRTVGAPTEQRLEINKNGTSNTITSVQKDNYAVELPEYRIRKLTPKECWRLMGCSDEDFEKAEQVNSNSQLYKQAGNAIVVDVLENIFSHLFLKEVTE